jgi:rod shape-determining protein MreB
MSHMDHLDPREMRKTLFRSIRRFFALDLAIDLGTANTRVYFPKEGTIIEKPTVADIEGESGGISSLGPCRPDIRTPLAQGVIVDQIASVSLLTPLIRRAQRHILIHPRILAFAPSDATEQERRNLTDVMRRAGAKDVAIVPEPLAAAIGAGMTDELHHAGMVVDIGAGVTDMAVIQEGRIIKSAAVRVACHDMQKAIRDMAEKNYDILPNAAELERLTGELCIPSPLNLEGSLPVRGASLDGGRIMTARIKRRDILFAAAPFLDIILGSLERYLRLLPNKTVCEVIESGIWLTGGGACIKNMGTAIESKTHIPVKCAVDPIHAVIRGASHIIQSMESLDHLWETMVWPISQTVSTPLRE